MDVEPQRRVLPSRCLPVLHSDAPTDLGICDEAAQLAEQATGPRNISAVKTLRISVTDRCNFRCVYCMPEEGVPWLPRHDLLGYEEIVEIARVAIGLGIRHFKITGGEPLVRSGVIDLIAMLRSLPGCGELSLTTNAVLLDTLAAPLRAAGLDRVTVSLDTLDPARFRDMTRTGEIERVWRGIAAAEAAGLTPIKLNVVVLRDYNLAEVPAFAALTRERPWTVRFIEFMPLARSKALTGADQFVPYEETRSLIEQAHQPLEPTDRDAGYGPANTFRLPGARGKIGFIHAMSAPFCSQCNRLRLTPVGELRSCLFDGGEVDLTPMLRPSPDPQRLRQAFCDCVRLKPDQHQMYGNQQMSRIGG